MNEANFKQAKQYALGRLERELPPNLFYHGLTHTRDDVVLAVERMAEMEGIRAETRLLLLTGAWFHDLGFVEKALHHELIGARIAVEVLPGFGYSEDEAEAVRWIILATALPQAPRNLPEQIMADADLDVLGREDFFARNDALRRELAESGKTFTDLEWFISQLKFVESHNYFTAAAHQLRDEKKRQNILALQQRIKALKDQGAA